MAQVKPKALVLGLILAGCGLLLTACKVDNSMLSFPDPPCCNHDMALECLEAEKALAADEIVPFYVTFNQALGESIQIDVSLETLEGAPWKAALCYEDQCFVHDGREKLVHEMTSGPATAFEIKFFVPEDAQPGETKTVRMTAVPKGDAKLAVAVDLHGYMP